MWTTAARAGLTRTLPCGGDSLYNLNIRQGCKKNFFYNPHSQVLSYLFSFMKKCIQCKELKPKEDFYITINSVGKKYRRGRCKNCHCKKTAENYRKNPEVKHMSRVKALYGISKEDYKKLFEKQNGKCAICELTFKESLCVDHNHKTGKVRGLLCHNCNRAIGLFKDNALTTMKATLYLS